MKEKYFLKLNKKNKHVFLTAMGQALRKKLVPLAQQSNRVSVAGLSHEEVLQARKVLLLLLHNLVQDLDALEGDNV